MDLNATFLTGRLTKDAEKKATESGFVVVKFLLANGYRRKEGEQWKDDSNFLKCVFIGNRADKIFPYLTKGRQVGVKGELRQQRWEQDGQPRSEVQIIVDDLQLFAEPQKSVAQAPTRQPAQTTQTAQPVLPTQPGDGLKGPESFEDTDDEIPF